VTRKHLPARDLAVDDARDVDAGFAHQIAPEFDHQFGFGQLVRAR
jgi:hypothetical protein